MRDDSVCASLRLAAPADSSAATAVAAEADVKGAMFATQVTSDVLVKGVTVPSQGDAIPL